MISVTVRTQKGGELLNNPFKLTGCLVVKIGKLVIEMDALAENKMPHPSRA